jgi:hypothetical protein
MASSSTLLDESMLRLLLNLSIASESDLEKARARYELALSQNSSEASLDEMIAAGWARVFWGRISTPLDIARTASSVTMPAFTALMANRYGQTPQLTQAVRDNGDLATVVAAIEGGSLAPREVGCQTPEWVAARLWDRPFADYTDLAVALRLWVDRWNVLGNPSVVPNRAWEQTEADAFCEAALHEIETEATLTGWEGVRALYVKQMAIFSQRPSTDADEFLPAVPGTVFDRAVWLSSSKLQRFMHWALEACGDLFGLVRLLLADVEAEDQAAAPHKTAQRLIQLALERPEILYAVLLTVEQHPVLLADLVFHPATSALACSLIARWPSPSSGWERELTTRDDQNTRAIAFVDAVSVMGHFLEVGSLHPEEVASLLDWMHKNARTGDDEKTGSSESMLAALRSELGGQSPEILQKMVGSLTASMPQSGLGTSRFAAALDIVDTGKLGGEIDPALLVTAYIESLAAGEYTLSANGVSISGAASLLELAKRAPSQLFQKFLYPIDVKAKLADASGENEYTVKDGIIRAVRTHVRVLSRAVAGRIEAGPDEVLNALIAAVRSGALGHEEKGRVAAFSARYETEPFRGLPDRPIAADLGAALSVLVEGDREQLLVAILETDEPMVLAQLLAFVPHAARGRIEKRIKDLTPSQAGEICSLTEAQERIEALLSAGLADAAAHFIEAERDLKPLGNPPGREMTRLRATLRLQLLRQEWAAIEKAEPSSEFPASEKASAAETISFYKALAVLQNPEGDRQAAEQMFTQLQRRRTDIPSYAINLFAAQISHLLGSDLFAQLDGVTLVRGRRILSDAEQMMLGVRAIGASDTEIFTCNKALLLLAVGQPERAYELLTSMQTTRLGDSRAAYSAVALSRTGRTAEAMAMLDQAEQLQGSTKVLQAARAHIKSGKAFLAIANVSSEDNPVPRIKAALFDLSQMDHIRQAEVLYSPPEPFDSFVIEHVRSASGSVTSLVPMMKGIKIDSCEDDLSALIRELLGSRFQFLGWSVPDQSKGGFTAKGNPGERDLLVQKDTATLAVLEAVVCNESLAKQNLTSHFQKVVGYSTCRLFFHLTYAYSKNPSSILEHLRKTAEKDAPAGFKYVGGDEIPLTDSRPAGFIARYAGDGYEIKVVFLLLDMGQHPQKEAAKTAAKKHSSPPKTN